MSEANPPLDQDEYYEYVYDQSRDYEFDDDEYQSELENAIADCGLDENDFCWNAGTEHCSFFCPFRHIFENSE